MGKYIMALILALVITAFIVWEVDSLTQSRANLAYEQGRARALIIEAQGQARLDSAQAAAITSAAALPWLIVFCISGVVIVCVTILLRQPAPPPAVPPARIIERKIIVLPPPARHRAELQTPRRKFGHIPVTAGQKNQIDKSQKST